MGVSACTSVPGASSLAVQAPQRAPVQVAYDTVAPPPVANRDAQADLMPIGAPVAAPAGFLDLCERSPADCTHSSVYNPDKIRTLARVALVERYKLAFAAMHAGNRQADGANQQTAAVAVTESASPAPAAADTVHYLSWSNRYESEGPVSYVQPLRGATLQPSGDARSFLPGLSLPVLTTPAAKGYISDFLDLSVDAHAWTELSAAAPAGNTDQALAINTSQPGAIASDSYSGGYDGARLSWANKNGNDRSDEASPAATIRPVSNTAADAPSIQYDLPAAPYDWAHVHIGTPRSADIAHEPEQAAATPADYMRIDMRGQTARIVHSVNDEVNRIMRGATDEQVYRVSDYWNAPDLTQGVRGDCEDYALEKRRLLIQSGIPAAALSIAIVRTRLGDDHAVLIVSSRQGDFVLDNLQYDIRPWRKTGYDWISRQGPGDDLGWVSLEPANNSASPWQARTVRIAYTQ